MILVGGENLIDFVQEADTDGLPRYVANPGGSPYNVAMALGRQDAPVGYLTPISTDSLGDLLANGLEQAGVKLLAKRSSKPTSLAVVSLDNGVPSYGFYRENTAERQVFETTLSAPDETQALHLGSLAVANGTDANVWEAFFHSCAANETFVAFDPNVRAAFIDDRAGYLARVERMAAASDLLKLSDEDLEWLYPDVPQMDAFERLHAMHPGALTVLTKGADGSYGAVGDMRVSSPPGIADPYVDTVGAGDTFSGTLMAELHRRSALSREALAQLSEDDLRSLLQVASKAAAINCSRSGCQPPTLAELS